MNLTPYESLRWAYQLHYCFASRTHRKKEIFTGSESWLRSMMDEICQRHEYRLLESDLSHNQLRLLLSLKPQQDLSTVVKTLKANSSREAGKQFNVVPPVWARGYWARGVGRVRIKQVRNYLDEQAEHHSYASRLRPPVFRYRTIDPVVLSAAHVDFDLSHHFVLATKYRKGVFTSDSGHALADYWLSVAMKRQFAIDQLTIVPDHVHLIVRTVPSMSIETCALLLMNNGQHFIGRNFPESLITNRIDQLWQASAYAGTIGDYTTASISRWLNSLE